MMNKTDSTWGCELNVLLTKSEQGNEQQNKS